VDDAGRGRRRRRRDVNDSGIGTGEHPVQAVPRGSAATHVSPKIPIDLWSRTSIEIELDEGSHIDVELTRDRGPVVGIGDAVWFSSRRHILLGKRVLRGKFDRQGAPLQAKFM